MTNSNSYSDGHILVVDDDAAILEAIQVLLELEGYSVRTATDAQTALQAVQKHQPQLVVLDVLLSGDDGRDIAKQLKSAPPTSAIPIVMMSAHPNVRQSVIDAGADDFMSKPFDMDVLLGFAAQYTHNSNNN
ncbi:MAG TPA: response regulator [Candidatus Levybacteria bacterium]|mgnify:CR=1 FL=1|nr:response regulator [Candidatus Levybacteria bacterium]